MADRRLLVVAVLAGGVVGAGLVDAWLSAAGYGELGAAVWVTGYGLVVLVAWYRYLRPLDLVGQDGGGTEP